MSQYSIASVKIFVKPRANLAAVRANAEYCGLTHHFTNEAKRYILGDIDATLIKALKTLDGVAKVSKYTPKSVAADISPGHYNFLRMEGQTDDDKVRYKVMGRDYDVELRGRRADVELVAHRCLQFRALLQACREAHAFIGKRVIDKNWQISQRADILAKLTSTLISAEGGAPPLKNPF